MKTQILSSVLLLSTLSLNAFAKPLPVIQAPRELVETSSEFVEGTVTQLTANDIAQFLPWAENAQKVLTKALGDIESMPIDLQVKHLTTVMQNVVRRSNQKNYQMFMRFSLNRGMLLAQELLKEADVRDSGVQENALDIQIRSIKLALEMYESDLSYQKRIAAGDGSIDLAYGNFGLRFARTMLSAVDSIFDASAQYRLLYKTYEILNWDLSRDAQANDNADTIIEIYNSLNMMNETPSADDRTNLVDIRRFNVLKDSIALLKEGASISQNSQPLRFFKANDRVIYGGLYYTILGKNHDGTYALQNTSGYITNSIKESDLEMTSGCYNGFCVGETVYQGGYGDYQILSISSKGWFSIKRSNWSISSAISSTSLGRVEGCLTGSLSNICVGTKVVYGSSRYTVFAILNSDKVAIKLRPDYSASEVNPKELLVIK